MTSSKFRFMMRHDPLKQWKLSPMDVESRSRREQYTKAKEPVFPNRPRWIVEAVDKKRARLNYTSHLLSQIPYKEVSHQQVALPRASAIQITTEVQSRKRCTFRIGTEYEVCRRGRLPLSAASISLPPRTGRSGL